MTIRILLSVSLIFSLLSSTQGQEKLRWKFTPGEQRTIVMTTNASNSSGVAGANLSTKTTSTMSWHVDQVDKNGSATIQKQVQRIVMTMNLPGMEPLTYDSANPDPEPNPLLSASLPLFQSLLDSPFEFTMTPQGKITTFKGAEELDKAIATRLKGAPSMTKQMLDSATVMFPPTPVEVGQTWGNQSTVETPLGKMTMDSQYTLIGDEKVDGRTLQKIGLIVQISMEPNASAPVKVELTDGRAEGELLFNNSAGCLVRQSVTTTMNMKMNDTLDMKTVQKMTLEYK